MAGYRLQPTVYRLEFEEHPGLEIMARSVSIDEFLKIDKLATAMTASPDEQQVVELFTWFAGKLIGWNLETGDGKPVPATVKGLLSQELPFALKLVMAWVNKVVRADIPLPGASSGGETTPRDARLEESIPMTPPGPES